MTYETSGFSGIKAVTGHFADFCRRHHMKILASGVDKHGAWEWSGWWRSGLNRYINLAMGEDIQLPDVNRMYWVEIWAVSDNDRQYVRQLTSNMKVSESMLQASHSLHWLENKLQAAWDLADSITEEALTESYLFPRSGLEPKGQFNVG